MYAQNLPEEVLEATGERWVWGHMTASFGSTEHLSEEAITAYVDDAMPSYVRIRTERHLHDCPECRALVEEQAQAREQLRQASEPLGTPGTLLSKLNAIPANDAVLRNIAANQGYAAATQYAVENDMVSTLHTIAQQGEIRAEWRALGAYIRVHIRKVTHCLSDKWQRGFRNE